jgi:hypothetical protein
MPHKTWRPSNQTSFETKEDFWTPRFVKTYHLGEIAT